VESKNATGNKIRETVKGYAGVMKNILELMEERLKICMKT